MKIVTVYQLVRLDADGYSVPRGTLGFIDERCEFIPNAVHVQWLEYFPGGGSVPVYEDDLKEAGTFSVPAVVQGG